VIAYLDESSRRGPSGLLYVVAAAVVVGAEEDHARAELRKLLLPRQDYLHWHNERPARRAVILDTISGLGVLAMAVSYHPAANRHQERARSACVTALAGDLRREGIAELVIEARQEQQNRADRQHLLDARHAGLLPDSFAYRHRGKKEEPLLWIADAIAGTVSAHLAGDDSTWWLRLAPDVLRLTRLGP